MAVTITLAQFDSGLYLLGGRESIPANALRVATGTNPVHARSLRSRNANVLIGAAPAISAARFAGNTYTVDTSGNLRKNNTIIASGFTPGARVSFTKAPPHFGGTSYGFIIGGGKAVKVDETGNVTNWGFAPPAATPVLAVFSGQAVFELINDFTSQNNLANYSSGLLSADTINFIISPQSTLLTVPTLSTGGFSQSIPLNLAPPNSTDFDTLQFFFQCSNPNYITAITLQFDIANSGFTTSFYTVQIPIGNFLGTQQGTGTTSADNLDASTLEKSPAYQTALMQLYSAAYAARAKANGWVLLNNYTNNFQPTLGALNNQQVNSITVTPAGGNWWKASIPRGAFAQIGAPLAVNNWSNITGFRFLVTNRSENNSITLNFQDFTFGSPSTQQNGGGFGLLGDYSYYFTYGNSVTNHYSLPARNNAPTSIPQIDRNAVLISGLPTTAPDSQIDTVTVWRTLGNGGIPYRCVDIYIGAGSNFNGNFVDAIADYAGFGPTPGSTTAPIPNWTANQSYPPGSLIRPVTGNPGAFIYIAVTAGSSGAVEPAAWNQPVGNYTTDNTTTWQNVGATLQLGLEPLELLSVIPPSTITACAFVAGTMFLAGDTAVGSRGRIYYSAVGYAEGLAGYTDISNDDDPTVGFGGYGGNLYVFTNKGLWVVNDISAGPYSPGWTASPVANAPGTLSLQSIQTSPLCMMYQSPEGHLVAFDGYMPALVDAQNLLLFHGDAAEGYPAIGQIVAAAMGRNEYWFSDGIGNLFAINMTPGAIPNDTGAMPATTRVHGTAATALFYEPDTGKMLAGWNGGTYHLEEYGNYNADSGTNTLPFAMRTGSFFSGDKYTAKGQRLFVNLNPGNNVVSVYVSVDGTDYLLGTATGAARANFEFPFNITGTLIGAYLTTPGGNGQVEVFRIALEVDVSGLDDAGSGSGPQGLMLDALRKQSK